MRLDDDPETLGALFGLLSYVVDETVVRAARVADLYGRLPEEKRAAIERRDERPATPEPN